MKRAKDKGTVMGRQFLTSMGGANASFGTTEWGLIQAARTENRTRRRAAMERLASRYWKPIYCYLRKRGRTDQDTKDLTQGFFAEVMLGRQLFRKADASRGRFRAFLLSALNRYVAEVHRASAARKRRPEKGLVPLDLWDADRVPAVSHFACPEDAFHWAWASELLERVLQQVREDCRWGGKEAHWKVFEARVLRPIAERQPAPSLGVVCARCGLSDEAQASNMIVTVKRSFRKCLRRHVRELVDSDEDVDAEIGELMRILSATSAGS